MFQGSLAELCQLVGEPPPPSSTSHSKVAGGQIKSSLSGDSSAVKFLCRYLKTSDSTSLQRVSMHPASLLQRGSSFSDYKHCYVQYVQSVLEEHDGLVPTDVFSQAIRQLHVSVLPDRLPCRDAERMVIEGAIRKAIMSRGSSKPLYISGMPGIHTYI